MLEIKKSFGMITRGAELNQSAVSLDLYRKVKITERLTVKIKSRNITYSLRG